MKSVTAHPFPAGSRRATESPFPTLSVERAARKIGVWLFFRCAPCAVRLHGLDPFNVGQNGAEALRCQLRFLLQADAVAEAFEIFRAHMERASDREIMVFALT